MPYIPQVDRARTMIAGPNTPGELNFVLTTIILEYIKTPSYAKYNEVIGVLECVKQELYRRAVAPYEDKKKEENGEVF